MDPDMANNTDSSRDAARVSDDRRSLLPTKSVDLDLDEEIDPMIVGHGNENASISSAIYNLSTTIIGAGIMGLPAKMKVLGLPLGLLTLVFLGVFSEYSVQLMLRCSSSAGVLSYADLMRSACGKTGKRFTRFFVIVNNLGILVIYLIIIADVLSGSGTGALHFPGLLEQWAGGARWWNSRFVVQLFSVLSLGPLVALEHVDSLHHSSALSIALAFLFVLITVCVTTVKLVEGTVDFSQVKLAPRFDTWHDVLQLFTVIPTMATAYVCHYNVHPIYVELAPPRDSNMRTATKVSLALCTSMYFLVSLFGYLLFGDAVQGDVLANFDIDLGVPYSGVLDDIIRASYALHLILVFPVINFSLRGYVDAVLFRHAAPLVEDKRRFVLITGAILGTVLCIAALLPNIDFAIHFTGSVAAVSLAFTCPGLAALRFSPVSGISSPKDRGLAYFMVILGVGCTVMGLSVNVINFFL